MSTGVICQECRAPVAEPPGLPYENRLSCPNCGSLARLVFVSSEIRANVESRLELSFPSDASFLLQAVLKVGEKTDEGRLIEAVTLPWFEIIKSLERDPSVAFQIDPRKWEELLAGAYKQADFDEVILTPRSGDGGRDIIAIKRGLGSIRIIDEVKAFGPQHLVSAKDVRALLGVLLGDGASKGFVTTTSDFAPKIEQDPIINQFMPSRLELINGQKLMRRLNELAFKR